MVDIKYAPLSGEIQGYDITETVDENGRTVPR